jgi:diaminopimelate decarboxylase
MPTRGFDYQGGRYHCEQVDLARVAEQCGTPCYVYSASSIVENYRAYNEALAAIPHDIHYAVKANSSIGLLALLTREGAGFDIVSGGELFRVLKAGGDASKVVFSGVGKSAAEIRYALDSGIGSFNCESEAELELLNEIAGELGLRPSVSLRVNPDINAETHPYIATGLHAHKFGIELSEAERIYASAAAMKNVDPNGVSCHIGSQIFDTGAFYEALDKVVELAGRLREQGLAIRNLDLGGGLAVGYRAGEPTPSIAGYASRLADVLQGAQLKLMLEPGRSIVGQAGVLLTKVLYRKRTGSKEFVIVDAAMNDLIRPALYQAHHEIVPLELREALMIEADVVGPVCETGDFLARDRKMPDCAPGEVLAVCTAGAYGFVQASNYNSRPRPPEVLVEGTGFRVIRDRESAEDLVRGERV